MVKASLISSTRPAFVQHRRRLLRRQTPPASPGWCRPLPRRRVGSQKHDPPRLPIVRVAASNSLDERRTPIKPTPRDLNRRSSRLIEYFSRCPLQPTILCHSPTNDFEGGPYPTHYPDIKEPPYDAHDAPPVEPRFLPEAANDWLLGTFEALAVSCTVISSRSSSGPQESIESIMK
jgi:hypothetical protein